MRAFIIRPFGIKQNINFDQMQSQLIEPVLNRFHIKGDTTASVVSAGNIREDIFKLIITADLVIADITPCSANVYYELGIRHALREKWTLLLCAQTDQTELALDQIPFDLRTDRYLKYQPLHPELAQGTLEKAIADTLKINRPDSPMFKLLTDLNPVDPDQFCPLPDAFSYDIKQAQAAHDVAKLALMGVEIKGSSFERIGLMKIGNAQLALQAYRQAATTWERLKVLEPSHVTANQRLATIYKNLKKWHQSEQAIQDILKYRLKRNDYSHCLVLLGATAEERWYQSFYQLEGDRKFISALESPFLIQAIQAYDKAYYADLNNMYAGVNLYSLYLMQLNFAEHYKIYFNVLFEDDDQADFFVRKTQKKLEHLKGALTFTLESAKRCHSQLDDPEYSWLLLLHAQFLCLTESTRHRVAQAYAKAASHSSQFALSSARKQLLIYQSLDIASRNVEHALKFLPDVDEVQLPKLQNASQLVLFTGHMVDLPSRAPRFPNQAAFIEKIRTRLLSALSKEHQESNFNLGLAGGACGGDILFHEICHELGINTELFLALNPEEFAAQSVARGGEDWLRRFYSLGRRCTTHVLSQEPIVPSWLEFKDNYTIWQRNNLWLLHAALTLSADKVTLIALWDGKDQGDGPGGTADFIHQAELYGVRTVIVGLD